VLDSSVDGEPVKAQKAPTWTLRPTNTVTPDPESEK
jgi:hypothetical protein